MQTGFITVEFLMTIDTYTTLKSQWLFIMEIYPDL